MRFAVCLALVSVLAPAGGELAPSRARSVVTLLRLPDAAIQPQLARDSKGGWHAIYVTGDPAAGDIFYTRLDERGAFAPAVRVNNQPGAALATGNVRGPHLAIGKDDRVHVAWVGSQAARPAGARDQPMMLYTRTTDARGTTFEPARNLAQFTVGLDGGDIAVDDAGTVTVAWHAAATAGVQEGERHLYIARSTDEGRTFAREAPADDGTMGACGCCGTRILASGSDQFVLFRAATAMVHRDTYLLVSHDRGRTFAPRKLDEWNIGACPMSTFSLAAMPPASVLAAWENDGRVRWTRIDRATGSFSTPTSVPSAAGNQKHPVIAANTRGDVIVVWTEGMAWSKGGAVAWQVYDRSGAPTADRGRAAGVPAWSLVAVQPRADNGFTIVY